MNERQIEIGDALLKYLQSKGGSANKDQYPDYLTDSGYGVKEWHQVLELLVELDLISNYEKEDYNIRLTNNGSKASEDLNIYLMNLKER